ncbi:hypothetical protein CEXT_320221 [Caerostris extrusa]|uniref:Uncharacterized protein n=1 Tax=Caerostris extrusa TaxID=172846 RepID=A0AAV4X0B1_CAEEX|nr:hypothetical protein CEXT_320221 [Caerostris extrusa]
MYQIHCPKQSEMNISINDLAIFPRAQGNSHQSTTLPSPSAEEPLGALALISNHPSCALVHRFSVLPEATLSHENELFATMDRSRGIFSYIIQCSEMRFYLY